MSSRREIDLKVKVRIVGVVENKEPVSLFICKNSKGISEIVDRVSKRLCDGGKVICSGRRSVDIDPEYPPEPDTRKLEQQH